MRCSMTVRGLTRGGLRGSFEAEGIPGEAAAAALPHVLVVDLGEDGDEGAGLELLGDGGDLAEAAGLAEGSDEAAALAFARGGSRSTSRS